MIHLEQHKANHHTTNTLHKNLRVEGLERPFLGRGQSEDGGGDHGGDLHLILVFRQQVRFNNNAMRFVVEKTFPDLIKMVQLDFSRSS
jgi:hypothetical protein